MELFNQELEILESYLCFAETEEEKAEINEQIEEVKLAIKLMEVYNNETL